MDFKKLKFSTVMTVFLFIIMSVYFAMSFQYSYMDASSYSIGSGFLPRWCSGIMLVLLVIYFFRSLKEEGISITEVMPKGVGLFNILLCWAGLIFFAVLAKPLGVVIASMALLFALYSRGCKWYRALIYSAITTAVCFVVFKVLLEIPLPTNQWGF